MRAYDQGTCFRVAVSESDVDAFNDNFPCSNLRGLTGVTFIFAKKNGDLVDIHYGNGSSDCWDGHEMLVLSHRAQKYGEKRLAKRKKRLAKRKPRRRLDEILQRRVPPTPALAEVLESLKDPNYQPPVITVKKD